MTTTPTNPTPSFTPNRGDAQPDPAPNPLARTLARHPRPLGGDPIRNAPATVSLSGLILNNAGEALQHMAPKRKPDWLRAKMPGGSAFRDTQANVRTHGLHTVCEEAACPNMGECWAEASPPS
jgi:hypothetical protein